MAAANLLALIDDIATLLDDVALMSKTAAKKTVGVLGDDLALNAQQVSGVRADRELPVVWAVAKGSFKNKLILVPLALLISAFLPPLITVLLIIGGLYLCFEGFEKVFHLLFHRQQQKQHQQEFIHALSDPQADILALEKQKIKGAIRTDFILSAEIIVISIGAVAAASIGMQILVVSALAIAITIGVYGIVAAIVKIDDAGLYLQQQKSGLAAKLGRFLLAFAPYLMKSLSILGTIAMFAVGGGILVHSIAVVHHLEETVLHNIGKTLPLDKLGFVPGFIVEILLGLIAGALVLLAWSVLQKILPSRVKTA